MDRDGHDADGAGWEARYRDGEHPTEPAPFVVAQHDLLPRVGRALDVAGGAGRHAVWLARRGLDVTLVDRSVAGLEIATRSARRSGVRVAVLHRDLEEQPLPDGPWDVVVDVAFLDRGVLAQVPDVLARGGWFVMVHPTVRNLERHERPPRRFLLDEGELRELVGSWSNVTVCVEEEGWDGTGRHTARIVARRTTRS